LPTHAPPVTHSTNFVNTTCRARVWITNKRPTDWWQQRINNAQFLAIPVCLENNKALLQTLLHRHFPDASPDNPDKTVVFFLDSHGSRYLAELSEWAVLNGVVLICVVPNCISLHQCLYIGYHAPFKRFLSTLCLGWTEARRCRSQAKRRTWPQVSGIVTLVSNCLAAKVSTLESGPL
jgi:hypothetical protein